MTGGINTVSMGGGGKNVSIANLCLEELLVLLDDLERAPENYRPTQFWRVVSGEIVRELQAKGMDEFKAHRSALQYYVPSYAKNREKWSRQLDRFVPWNSLRKLKPVRRLSEYMDGRQNAISDYRVVRAAIRHPMEFMRDGESAVGAGLLHRIEGGSYGKAALNYLRGLAFLQKTPGYREEDCRTFLEIGGGFGSFGEILLRNSPLNRYADIDIPPVVSVAAYYLKRVFGEAAVMSYRDSREYQSIDTEQVFSKYRCVVLPSWQLPLLQGSFDCFVNFVSFQEMEPHVVQSYIERVMPLIKHYVILRNSRHGKRLAVSPDSVGVQKATTIDMMISWFSDFRVVDRDSLVFGDETRFGSFKSEVVILKRL